MRTATIFNFLVEATLIGSVLILLTCLARPLCRKAVGSRVLCLAWVLIGLRLLTPIALPNPAMNALKPTLSRDPGLRPMADQIRTRVEDATRSLYWKAADGGGESAPLSGLLLRLMYAAGNGRLSRMVMALYLAGCVLAAAWMLWENLRFRADLKRRRTGGLSPGEQADYEAMCARRGLTPLAVHRASGLSGSCRLGREIFLPDNAPEALLPAMLLRESCHKRLTLYGVLRCLCCTVHWYNPLVWLGAHLFRTDIELACDQRAWSPMEESERKAFARLMLTARDVRRTTPRLPVAASCITMTGMAQRLRIRCALHAKPVRRTAAAVYCALFLLGGLIMFSTDVQTSIANLPQPDTASLRPAAPIATAEEAQAWAKAFLTMPGVDAQPVGESPYITRTDTCWQAEWYGRSAAAPVRISFTPDGQVLFYEDPAWDTRRLHPLAQPITSDTVEGQQWCAFLTDFARLHLPECYDALAAMKIVRSGRLDGEQFIVVHLLDETRTPRWEMTVQVAPTGRILSFIPID